MEQEQRRLCYLRFGYSYQYYCELQDPINHPVSKLLYHFVFDYLQSEPDACIVLSCCSVVDFFVISSTIFTFEFMALSGKALTFLMRYGVYTNETAKKVKSNNRVKTLLFQYMFF